jgi:flagellar protein FliS
MTSRAATAYRRVYLRSAPQTTLLDELYCQLFLDIADARRHILARDAEHKGESLNHAIAILRELQGALDYAVSPMLCADLNRLYEFSRERLVEANLRFEAAPLADVERVLVPIREAFRAASQDLASR